MLNYIRNIVFPKRKGHDPTFRRIEARREVGEKYYGTTAIISSISKRGTL